MRLNKNENYNSGVQKIEIRKCTSCHNLQPHRLVNFLPKIYLNPFRIDYSFVTCASNYVYHQAYQTQNMSNLHAENYI